MMFSLETFIKLVIIVSCEASIDVEAINADRKNSSKITATGGVGSCLFKLNNGGKEGGVTAADSGRRARRREGEGIRGERGIEAMLV